MPRFVHITITVLIGVSGSLLTHTLRAQPPGSPVTAVEVVTETLREEVALTGTSIAHREARISPRLEGLVTRVFVDEGSWVKRGDRLVALERRLAEIEINSARARVDEARARYADAVRRRNELSELNKKKHVSVSSLDGAKADVEVAAAVLARERSELERRQELLARHTVTAPFAGMVIRKHVEEGQWAKTDTAMIELVAIDTLRIKAALPQRYYTQVGPDAKARVRFDALPGRNFAGTVFARLVAGSESTRSFPLLIDITNAEHLLAPGMSARVFVELKGNAQPAIVVPRDSVVTQVDGSRQVWRIEPSEQGLKVVAVSVRIGRAHGDRLEVLGDSLAPGDRIVFLGNERLHSGQLVSLREPPAESPDR